MENKKLQNGIEDIKNITMTDKEKNQILEHILISYPEKDAPIRSPWFTYSFISRIQKTRLAYYVVIPLIFILAGSGIVSASEDSLPDSVFYPIKVNIVEPIREVLTFSKENKAHYESSLATERLVEAETLAKQGKLDVKKEKQLNDLLAKHSKKFDEAINNMDQIKSPEKVDKIIKNFQHEMHTHADALDTITNDENVISDNKIETEINNTEIPNKNKIKKERNDNPISDSARINADYMNNKFKDMEDRDNSEKNHNFNDFIKGNGHRQKENNDQKEDL